MNNRRALGMLAGGALLCSIAGCATCDKQECTKQPAPAPQAQRADTGTRMSFPTGVDATSVIAIDKVLPQEAVAGQPFDYKLIVTNLTDMTIRTVMVRDVLSGNVKVNNAAPPLSSGSGPGELSWILGDLQPREIKEIRVNATPADTGVITSCANVSYESMLCLTMNVVKPALDLTMSMPKEASLCDPVPMKVLVKNSGTGAARNVHVRPELPLGFSTVDGAAVADLDAGTLASGQSREFILNLKASKVGTYAAKAAATGDGGLTALTPPSDIAIRRPVLTITGKSREQQFIGRPIGFELTVTNTGDWPATDAVLQTAVPAGAAFASATAGGILAPDQNRINWTLGTIEPKASKTVAVNFTSNQLGLIRCEAAANATCATPVTTYAQTDIAGIPAVLLEMVDDPDPVEVGQNTVYTITVTNQGSATDTNIKLMCTMESDASMQFVGATGATPAVLKGEAITFVPLAKLAPKAQAQWKVTIKALKAHDSRFSVEMMTDQLTEGGVIKTESTHFYK